MKFKIKKSCLALIGIISIFHSSIANAQDDSLSNSLGMKFVKIPNTSVLFSVYVTRVQDYSAYYVESDSSSINKQWINPMYKGENMPPGGHYPVINVNWDDAKAFCDWLSKKEGKRYRLPTDSEWSIAAGLNESSEGTPASKSDKIKDVYNWGTGWPPPKGAGNFDDHSENAIPGYYDGYVGPSPVGIFQVNKFGLYDLAGNVWEWCEDWFDEKEGMRVMRGRCAGSSTQQRLWLSNRHEFKGSNRNSCVGFRVVLEGK